MGWMELWQAQGRGSGSWALKLFISSYMPPTTGLKDFLTMTKWQVLPLVVLKSPKKIKKAGLKECGR